MGAAGLEHPLKPPEKQGVTPRGGAESGAQCSDTFAEALALIWKLPLSDIEKAEAVRRLLAASGRSSYLGSGVVR